MPAQTLIAYAVILAGGRGTRFWPRSRTRTPKQLLNIVGADSMLQQTVARLRPMIPAQRVWTVTNNEQADELRNHLPSAARKQVLVEPVGRNTAAAIALAAIHIRNKVRGDALMAVLPADLHIANAKKYLRIAKQALQVAAEPGRMVVLGIPPTRPETGFGYIQCDAKPIFKEPFAVYPVRAFTEKPALRLAKKYLASGHYRWNSGMFFWRVTTFLDQLKKHLPKTDAALEELALAIGTRSYESKLRAIYPRLENISVDYALLENTVREKGIPRVFAIPADVGWSDIGSWTAVHERVRQDSRGNAISGDGCVVDADGNFVWSPGKFVGLIGVRDLVVVETPDALLICPRERSQDAGKIVKWLEAKGRKDLL
jgi:mannose-1-phosphate guanylyltransferase